MLIDIPGAKGLFSVLQAALQHQTDNRVRLLPAVRDFRWLAQDLTSRPTRFAIGTADAAGAGMGGVWYVEPNLARSFSRMSTICG
jgi:hypothetical protein